MYLLKIFFQMILTINNLIKQINQKNVKNLDLNDPFPKINEEK